MWLVDTKIQRFRVDSKKNLIDVPFVIDERELMKQRGERDRAREKKGTRGLIKRYEYGTFRLIVVVVVVIGLETLKKCKSASAVLEVVGK